MKSMHKEDIYIQVFMGASYDLSYIRTIGELTRVLEQIIDELPPQKELEISEITLHKGKLEYLLKEGIPQ